MSHCIACNLVMRKALRPVSHQTRPKTPELMKANAVNARMPCRAAGLSALSDGDP
jgi:hypothetical protein